MEIALALDADSRRGVAEGLPALLDLFRRQGIAITIFANLGPPWPEPRPASLGRESTPVPGLFSRLFRRNDPPVELAPLDPLVAPILEKALSDGHEIGVRPWNLPTWESRLTSGNREALRESFLQAALTLEGRLGEGLKAFAAPGWRLTEPLLELEDERELLYGNDCRGTWPFFPSIGDRTFRTLQVPTTLPTWDEVLGSPGLDDSSLLAFYRSSVREGIAQVHRIHAEIEGISHLPLFVSLVEGWKKDGVRFVRLDTAARRALSRKNQVRTRKLIEREIPGRSGLVSCEA